jgi:hypothetical protein
VSNNMRFNKKKVKEREKEIKEQKKKDSRNI